MCSKRATNRVAVSKFVFDFIVRNWTPAPLKPGTTAKGDKGVPASGAVEDLTVVSPQQDPRGGGDSSTPVKDLSLIHI